MSVSGKSTAFARYSPISAESLASFLRSSSTFLAVASVAAVVATRSVAEDEKLVVESETFSTLEIRVLRVTLPSKAVDAVSDDSPTLSVSELVSLPASVTVSFVAVCDPATVDEAEILVDADLDALVDAEAEALVEADSDAEVLADSEADVLTDTDALVEADSDALVLADTDADSLADTDSLSLND